MGCCLRQRQVPRDLTSASHLSVGGRAWCRLFVQLYVGSGEANSLHSRCLYVLYPLIHLSPENENMNRDFIENFDRMVFLRKRENYFFSPFSLCSRVLAFKVNCRKGLLWCDSQSSVGRGVGGEGVKGGGARSERQTEQQCI